MQTKENINSTVVDFGNTVDGLAVETIHLRNRLLAVLS